VVATGSFLISFLLDMQSSIWVINRPWYAWLLGWVYPACGLLTLVTIAVALHRHKQVDEPRSVAEAVAN
jgi:alpha-1,2-mannosyltransferase